MRAVRAHLTFANVVSVVALFVALGGSAWAISANSVGSKQIKKGAVKKTDLAGNAVISTKVADGSLLAGDFAAGQLPAGERGATGPQGTEGIQGPQGVQGLQGQQGEDAPGQASPNVFAGIDFKTPYASTQLDGAGGPAIFWAAGSSLAMVRLAVPDGAAITKIEFDVVDNTGGTFSFGLDGYIPSSGITVPEATAASTGASPTIRTFTMTPPSPVVVQNQSRVYELRASSNTTGTGMQLWGARVFFTLP